MSLATAEPKTATQQLSLPEELILMLLDDASGYFHQVPGWDLNCAMAGAVLAELSLISRIDTDLESLILLDSAETGDPVLDPVLREIAADPVQRNARYWIERIAPRADSIIDGTLDRLVKRDILEHHDGEFWSLAPNALGTELYGAPGDDASGEFVRTRISRQIFSNEIPGPRDVLIVCLADTCDVLRFIFQLDEEAEERIKLISRLDQIGRSIVDAVTESMTGPLLQRASLTKPIPRVSLPKLLLNRRLREGNTPALFADLAKEYGPVFELRAPFQEPMVFLAGPETNHWAHRHGRMYLRTKDYLADFEKVYGANGILPALDGADHFRFRKAMQQGYSRARLEGQLDDLLGYARSHMADWKAGDAFSAPVMCRELINAQISPLMVGVDTQDLMDDLVTFKVMALNTHVVKALPKFLLKTPAMKRRAASIDTLLERVQNVHTPAQRAGCPRDLADDLLSLHASDKQFLPESNLRFVLSAPLIASVYLGDGLSFALYAMVTQPELYERIRAEADAAFANGDPTPEDLTPAKIDVTHRFIMETLRMYPIVPVSLRNVMNACVVEGHELKAGTRLIIAQAAAHYMEDVFPDPHTFDIDRYKPPRDEHRGPGYAPFGLGTHTCLGSRWMEMQLAVNLLALAHYFTIEASPRRDKPMINPLPSLSLGKKMKFHITERRRELPA